MEVAAEQRVKGKNSEGMVMVLGNRNWQRESSLPRAFKIDEIANSLQVSTRHIRRKVQDGSFPQPINIGKSLRFMEADILAYIEEQKLHGAN